MLKEKGYRTGSIVKVQLKNFLTYDNADVYPGPRLNVVLGPNGTGKSALTHAICLACGGDPKSVGRSPDLKQFVKRGCDLENAYAEVHLLKDNRVVSVRRTINSQNKTSKWHVNGTASTQKDVKELMNSMNIDVDNLCSFMAQDKVGNFSQANAKEILRMTLESIVNEEGKKLSDEQKELSCVEETKLQKQLERDNKQSTVNELNSELESMQSDVDRMHQRNELKDQKSRYEIKYMVVKAKELRLIAKESDEKVLEAQKTYEDASSTLEPLHKERREIEKRIAERSKANKNTQAKLRKAEENVQVSSDAIDEVAEDVKRAVNKIAGMQKERDNAEEDYKKIKESVDKLEADYQKSTREVLKNQERLDTCKQDISTSKKQSQELEIRVDAARDELEVPMQEKRRLQKELSSFKDPRVVYIRTLSESKFPIERNIAQAMQKLIKLEESDMFRGNVYGPLGYHISVTGNDTAKLVQAAIGIRNLQTFVCQNADDEAVLRRELNEKSKLGIDISVVKTKPPVRLPCNKEAWAEIKKEFPNATTVNDVTIMPEVVRDNLLQWNQISQIIISQGPNVSDKITDGHMDKICRNGNGRCVWFTMDGNGTKASITRFDGQISQYNKDRPASMSRADNLPLANYMLGSGESSAADEKSEIEGKIYALDEKLEGLNATISRLQKELMSKKSDLRSLEKLRQTCQSEVNAPETKKKALDRKKDEKRRCLERLQSLDDKSSQTDISDAIKKSVEEQLEVMGTFNDQLDKYYDAYMHSRVLDICSGDLQGALDGLKIKIEEKKAEVEEFKTAIKDAQRNRDKANADFKSADDAINAKCNDLGGQNEFTKLYKEIMRKCPEETTVEIETCIFTIETKLGESADNSAVLVRYNRVKESLAEAKRELEAAELLYNNANETMHARSHNWKTAVHALTEKMGVLFQEYMAELNFGGELKLKETGTIDQYEMCLKVAFRAGEVPSELSGQSHSGGERAVSTIMYLMALQEMTTSPFRVVDEINQGMDERNERLVFDRIVQSCCGDNTKPQYFLVSPKLLPGLRSMDHNDITVLLVFNGPGIAQTWHLSEVIEGYKRRLEEKGVDVEPFLKKYKATMTA